MINQEEEVQPTSQNQPTSDSHINVGQADQSQNKEKNLVKKCCCKMSPKTADILRIVRIRILLTITVAYMIGSFYCVSKEPTIFISMIPVVYFWAEAIYISIKNDAKEWYW